MILISHRGNVTGKNPDRENNPLYILDAINQGFDVEVDVWYDNGWWLGHDEPKYKVKLKDLSNFWCHVKNINALEKLNSITFPKYNFFWHQTDDFTITSNGYVICHSGKNIIPRSICMLPEQGYKGNINYCIGICSDFIKNYENIGSNFTS